MRRHRSLFFAGLVAWALGCEASAGPAPDPVAFQELEPAAGFVVPTALDPMTPETRVSARVELRLAKRERGGYDLRVGGYVVNPAGETLDRLVLVLSQDEVVPLLVEDAAASCTPLVLPALASARSLSRDHARRLVEEPSSTLLVLFSREHPGGVLAGRPLRGGAKALEAGAVALESGEREPCPEAAEGDREG